MKTSLVKQGCCSAGTRRQHGFAIVSAIFLLVVLGLMAAFIMHVSTHQQAGHVADLRGVRAYQAARVGVEWGLHNHLRNAACAAPSTFAPGGNLAEFTVTVTCVSAINDENGTPLTMARIVATACNLPGAGGCPNPAPPDNYIERELAVVAGR